jgi:hypothetical protein
MKAEPLWLLTQHFADFFLILAPSNATEIRFSYILGVAGKESKASLTTIQPCAPALRATEARVWFCFIPTYCTPYFYAFFSTHIIKEAQQYFQIKYLILL